MNKRNAWSIQGDGIAIIPCSTRKGEKVITNYRCPECKKTWNSGKEDGLMDNTVWFELCEECATKRDELAKKLWENKNVSS